MTSTAQRALDSAALEDFAKTAVVPKTLLANAGLTRTIDQVAKKTFTSAVLMDYAKTAAVSKTLLANAGLTRSSPESGGHRPRFLSCRP